MEFNSAFTANHIESLKLAAYPHVSGIGCGSQICVEYVPNSPPNLHVDSAISACIIPVSNVMGRRRGRTNGLPANQCLAIE